MDELTEIDNNDFQLNKLKRRRSNKKSVKFPTTEENYDQMPAQINLKVDNNNLLRVSSATSTRSSSSSSSSLSSSREPSYSRKSNINDKSDQIQRFQNEKSRKRQKKKMTNVRKLTLKFEKLAVICNSISNINDDNNKSKETLVLPSPLPSEKLISSSSLHLQNLHPLAWKMPMPTTKLSSSSKNSSYKSLQETPSDDDEEIYGEFSDSDASYETCDMSDNEFEPELEQKLEQQYHHHQQDEHEQCEDNDHNQNNQVDDIDQVQNNQQQQQQQQQSNEFIPRIFVDESGESCTNGLNLNNTKNDNKNDLKLENSLMEFNTNGKNFRKSDPTPSSKTRIYEARNKHVASKSISYYPTNSDEESLNINATAKHFSSKLSLVYDSKDIPPIIEELIRTEETYVKNLKIGIQNYGCVFNESNKNLPIGLKGKKWVVFGNIEQIYEFHKIEFLPMLHKYQFDLKDLFDEFLKFIEEDCFYCYVLYTMNKRNAVKTCEQYRQYFREVQEMFDDRLGITSFLIEPIQRLTRYPLLMQQFITASFAEVRAGNKKYKSIIESCCKVEKRIRNLLCTVNEAEEINDIEECYDINIFCQGKFKKMSEFNVYDYTQRRNYSSKVFIFDKCLIYTECHHKDKRLIYRGCYPCEHIGFISKQKSFTLYYDKHKIQECEFIADKIVLDQWIDLIRDMISVFAQEEKRRLKEKYSRNCDIYRRSSSISLLRNSSRLSTDSGTSSAFSASSSSTASITNSQEETASPRTTWYADSLDIL